MRSAIALVLIFAASFSHCEEPSEDYKELVDDVLELTGGLAMANQMSNLFISEFLKVLKNGKEEVPENVIAVVEEEVTSIIGESIGNGDFQEMLYPLYAKHVSQKDLKAMIKFYRSKEGRRIVSALPLLTQESIAAGQAWGSTLGPKISARIKKRLETLEADERKEPSK